MATITSTSTIAYAINEIYQKGFVEGVYYNDVVLPILKKCGMIEKFQGASTYRWVITTTGNTSVTTFSEGDIAPQAVATAYANPYLSPTYYWAFVQISGHARDALKNNPEMLFDAIDAEMQAAMMAIVDLRSTTTLTALATGVDSTTAYAGVTRGSAGYFEASELDGTFTIARLRALYNTMRSPDKGGNLTVCLVPPAVMDIYANIGGTAVGGTATNNASLRFTQMADGTPFRADFGYDPSGMRFMNAPIYEIPDMTSSEFYLLDVRQGQFEHVIWRPFQVDYQGRSGDSDTYEISTGSLLAIKNPKTCAKFTSVS